MSEPTELAEELRKLAERSLTVLQLKRWHTKSKEAATELDRQAAENKRLREVFDHPNQDFPKERYLSEIQQATILLKDFAKIEGGGELAFGTAMQLEQFRKRAEQALKAVKNGT